MVNSRNLFPPLDLARNKSSERISISNYKSLTLSQIRPTVTISGYNNRSFINRHRRSTQIKFRLHRCFHSIFIVVTSQRCPLYRRRLRRMRVQRSRNTPGPSVRRDSSGPFPAVALFDIRCKAFANS